MGIAHSVGPFVGPPAWAPLRSLPQTSCLLIVHWTRSLRFDSRRTHLRIATKPGPRPGLSREWRRCMGIEPTEDAVNAFHRI